MHLWICEGQTNGDNTQRPFNAEHDHHCTFVSTCWTHSKENL